MPVDPQRWAAPSGQSLRMVTPSGQSLRMVTPSGPRRRGASAGISGRAPVTPMSRWMVPVMSVTPVMSDEPVDGAGDAGGSAEVDGAGGSAGDGAEVDGAGDVVAAGDGAAVGVSEVEVEGCGDCLLTGLSARVGPEGVLLMWTVDEARAERITGFSCSYRAPSHTRFGVTGAIGCGAGFESAEARSAVVAGLPEFGEYDFEVAATVDAGPAIYWGERSLRLREVAVTEDLAGPAGPALAVTGAGPVVTGCGPGDGPGVTAPQRPWELGRIVSDVHLTHYPGRGWSAGGDPRQPPDWPEPLPLDELLEEAGLDGGAVDRAAAGTSEEQQAAAAALLADERGAAVVALISARTKALLRPGFRRRLGAAAALGLPVRRRLHLRAGPCGGGLGRPGSCGRLAGAVRAHRLPAAEPS